MNKGMTEEHKARVMDVLSKSFEHEYGILRECTSKYSAEELMTSAEYILNIYRLMFGVGLWILEGFSLTGPDGLIKDDDVRQFVKKIAPLGLAQEMKKEWLEEYKIAGEKLLKMLNPANHLPYLCYYLQDDEMYLRSFTDGVFSNRQTIEIILIGMETILGLSREQILADQSMVTADFSTWLESFDQRLRQKLGILDWLWPQEEIHPNFRERFFFINVTQKYSRWGYWRDWFLVTFVFSYHICGDGPVDRFLLKFAEEDKDYIDTSKLIVRMLMKFNPIKKIWRLWHIYIASRIRQYYYPHNQEWH